MREATEELRQAYQEIADTYEDTLRSLCSALDAREEETGEGLTGQASDFW